MLKNVGLCIYLNSGFNELWVHSPQNKVLFCNFSFLIFLEMGLEKKYYYVLFRVEMSVYVCQLY